MSEANRVRAAIESEVWLMTEGALEQIRLVAAREHDPSAISSYVAANGDRELSTRVGSTAVLDVRGPLTRYASMMSDVSGLSSTEQLAAEFAELEADADVARIVLQMNTPGGAADGIAEFAAMIANAATPTVAFSTGQCCSAGVWLATACNEFLVASTSIVGCIGVRARAPGTPDEDELVSRYAPAKLGSRAASQAVIDRLEDEFLAAVAAGRGVTVEHVIANYGGGGVFVGVDAVTAGLADGVATLDQILAGLAGATRVQRTSTKPPRGTPMTGEANDGGMISLADHEAAIVAAVTMERQRVSAILAAGAGKPEDAVRAAIEQGIDGQAASVMLSAIPSMPSAPLDPLGAAMVGRDPRIAPGARAGSGDEARGYDSASVLAGARSAIEEMTR